MKQGDVDAAFKLLVLSKYVRHNQGFADIALSLFSVTLEGSHEGRVFDQRELKFEIGDGENLGFPPGVEKSIMAMEEEEEAFFILKPKYDPLYHAHASVVLFFLCSVSLYCLNVTKNVKTLPAYFNCVRKPCHLLKTKFVHPQRNVLLQRRLLSATCWMN